MEQPRIAILSGYDRVSAFLDNSIPSAMHYFDEKLNTFITGSAYTFSFKTSTNHADSQFLIVGNKLSFMFKGKGYYCNIVNTEIDEDYIRITAHGLSLELTNEDLGPYKASNALTFEEYVNAFGFETATITIAINEVSDKRLTHEWDGTDSVLARLFSLANVFNAELEFISELNDDYSLKQITMNVYKEHDSNNQGYGTDRRKEIIRYGKGIESITKTSDIAELYTAIRPTGTDGLTLTDLDKTEYDSNGNVEFRKEKGTPEILAPQARDRFPASLLINENGRYICKLWSYDTSDINTLYGQSLAMLKKLCEPQVSYKVEGFVDANIGDTFVIEDTEYNPTLYIEARVAEQLICFTDSTQSKTTFDNFIEVESNINSKIIDQMNDLIESNKTFIGSIYSDKGIVLKKETDSTTLTAAVYDNANNVTSDFTINWYKNNKLVKTGMLINVIASDLIDDSATFKFEAINSSDVIKATSEVTVSSFQEMSEEIELRVLKKEIIGAINESQEEVPIAPDKISLKGKQIDLTSDNVTIDSNNFKVDKYGKIKATAGQIGGLDVSSNGLSFVRTGIKAGTSDNCTINFKMNSELNSFGADIMRWDVKMPSGDALPGSGGSITPYGVSTFAISGVEGHFQTVESAYRISCGDVIYSRNNRCITTLLSNGKEGVDRIYFGNAERSQLNINAYDGGYYGVKIFVSDKRLKNNIRDTEVNHALDKISQLEHVSFDWKQGGNHCRLGYVADDVEKVLSCLVFETKNGENEESNAIKNIDHTTLLPLITMGMQELVQENKYLWEFNNAVVEEVCTLKNRLDRLEKLLGEKGE